MIRVRLFLGLVCGSPLAWAFQESTNLPVRRIGADDLIAVSVYDSPELSRPVRVDADGFLRLPMLERAVRAQGLLPGELERALAAALRDERLVVDPAVSVTVAEYRSRPVSVAGAVRKPVTFQAASGVTLLDAIARAEGLAPEAGAEILVTRARAAEGGSPARATQHIPVRALLDGVSPAANLELTGGEEIRVPEAGRVYVAGNVRRPGAYSLKDQDRITLLEILALAEGLAPFAAREAYLYRRPAETAARREFPVALRRILDRKADDVALQAGDILYVPDNRSRRLTVSALERIAGFGAATASGVLIWRR